MGQANPLRNPFKEDPNKLSSNPAEDVSPFEDTALASPLGTPEKSGVHKRPERSLEQKLGFADVERALSEKYMPHFLAEGGENIVYEIPGHPDIVLKGSKKVLYDILSDPKGETHALNEAKNRIDRERMLQGKLREHFGAEHLLRQKQFLMKVPVTREILAHTEQNYLRFFHRTIPQNRREAWTYVTIQKKQELKKGSYENPKAENINPQELGRNSITELSSMDASFFDPRVRKDFEEVSEGLLRGERAQRISEADFSKLIGSRPLNRLLHRMRGDEGLREAVKSFVENCVHFAEDTGEIIDFVGKDNIVFLKEDDRWTYKLLDPLFPFYDHVLEDARKIFVETKGEGIHDMDTDKSNKLTQAFVFVRLINGLAVASGAEASLDFLPEELLKNDTLTSRIIPKATEESGR